MRAPPAWLRSVVYGTLFLGFWAWLALQVRRFDPALSEALGGALAATLPAWTRGIGAVLMAVGGALALWCAATFVIHGEGGTPAPFDPPRAFVATGPYRRVRNPMYLALLGLLAGYAMWHRSPAMLGFVGLVWLLAHLFVVLYEEPKLEREFGEPYRAYRRSVNRWWPRRPGEAS